jgi:PAS domain S-box-containing protein
VLLGVLLVLGGSSLIASLQQTSDSLRDYRESRIFSERSRIAVQLLTAGQHIADERDRTMVVLRDNHPASGKHLTVVGEQRQLADAALETALSNVGRLPPALHSELVGWRQKIGDLRRQVDHETGLPPVSRNKQLAERWFVAASGFIDSIQHSTERLIGENRPGSKTTRLTLLAAALLQQQITVEGEASGIAKILAAGKPPTVAALRAIYEMRGKEDQLWHDIDRLAAAADVEAVRLNAGETRKQHFAVFRTLQDQLLVELAANRRAIVALDKLTSASLPILDDMSALMIQTTEQVLLISGQEEASARASLIAHIAWFASILLLLILSLRYVVRYVVSPLEQIDRELRHLGALPAGTETGSEVERLKASTVALEQSFAALAKADQRMALLDHAIDQSSDALFLIDDQLRFTYVNAAACRSLGYSREELLAMSPLDIDPDATLEKIRGMTKGKGAGSASASPYIMRHRAKDGRIFPVELSASYVEFDGRLFVLTSVRDITERKRMEESLAAHEREFRVLAENLPDPIFRYDRNCRRVYVNPAAERVTATPADQLLGKLTVECGAVESASAERATVAIREVLATGERRSLFVEYIVDGKTSEYQGLLVPEFDANGQVATVLAIAHEVTDLRAAERRAENFFANMPGFAYTFSLSPEGRMSFPFASRGVEEIFGLRPEDIREDAAPLLALANFEDRSRIAAEVSESARTLHPFQIDARVQRPDQPERWIECHSIPERQADGGVLWHGIMLDITERKAVENSLLESRKMLSESQRIAHVGSWEYDIANDTHLWSDELFRIFEIDPVTQGASYEGCINATHPDDREAIARTYIESVETGKPYESEHRLLFPDGRIKYVRERCETICTADGTPLRSQGMMQDITDFKRYEAARESALAEAVRLAKARSEFLAQMSHELRTPLNGILGYTQILQRDTTLSERNADALKIIRDSGEHLLSLIEDILDLARIEAGRFQLDLSNISLATFLRIVANIVGLKAKQKGIEFSTDLAADLPAGIRGDDKRLRQVLLNLLSNAIKFTDQGRVVLRIRRVTPSRLAFEVEDTGVGIAAHELETIFQPFEQAGDTKQRLGGSGLGLAISRQLVRLMGGDITVESRIGEGSIFRFELELPAVEIGPAALLAMPDDGESEKPYGDDEYAGSSLIPPVEEMQTLHRLAQLGNMRDILQFAERIAHADPHYRPFAARLHRMAEGFQSKAILAFVEGYINDSK